MYTFLLKPTNNCNLRCKYCFIDGDYKSSSPKMDMQIAEMAFNKISTIVKSKNHRSCNILWHGGEPMLWGLTNYLNLFKTIESRHSDIKFQHSIQTNLLLLDEQWLDFFIRNSFHVSTSLDGTKRFHDLNRKYINGKGSFEDVLIKIKLANKRGLHIGVIVVVNSENVNHLIEIYEFFKKEGIGFKLNPILMSGDAVNNEKLSISAESYAKAMNELFDTWIQDEHTIPITNFIEISSNIITHFTSVCVFSENCQRSFTTIEPNGDITPCDRLCGNSSYVFGNIMTDDLFTCIESKMALFENRYLLLQKNDCFDCSFFNICRGGCPADAIQHGDLNRKSPYCAANRLIFEHIHNYLVNNNF